MHKNNPFLKDYDFTKLVQCHPQLKSYIFTNTHKKVTVKFSDPKAVKALNTALLKYEYEISWDIPDQNLCPPIPGRLDYILHIADLLKKENVHLLDIGTGASLIYPILATCHFKWKCTASEIENESLVYAQKLINTNTALRDIKLRQQKNRNHILQNIIQEKDNFDVLICNPPFFKNKKEADRQSQRKVKNLNLQSKEKNFGGRSNELWCPGGEKKFIETLVKESLGFKDQIHWFSSLISNDTNLRSICKTIKKTKPTGFKIIPMKQGNKNSRIIAWSYLKK